MDFYFRFIHYLIGLSNKEIYSTLNEWKKSSLKSRFFLSDPFIFSVPFETKYTTADCQSILLMFSCKHTNA